MSDRVYADPQRRHDFVLLFEVTDGNPNGDPDAGNMPRVDPETMQGLVTDVCLKRKVRDWVDAVHGGKPGMRIYVQSKGIALNDLHQEAYKAEGLTSTGSKQKREDVHKARAYMCEHFYDIRMFGAVMTTDVNCGQVRGPLQLTFARSLDPVVPMDLSITRVAVTRHEDVAAEDQEQRKTTEMGRKAMLPYGLFRAHGFFNPHFAEQTGAAAGDLDIFWAAVQNMWDLDRSSSRGMMACRGLHVFTHDNAFGRAPAQTLFDRVRVERRAEGSPRKFSDYSVTINSDGLPEGVTLTRLVG